MKKYLFIALVLQFFTNNIYCQINIGKIWQCQTMEGYTSTSFSNQAVTLATVFDTSTKIVNIFVHVLNQNDGTGGLSTAQVNAWISLLCNDYLAHNISIREIGRSSINNTTYFNKQINLTDFNNIITIDTHNNAIDIYLLSPTETFSRANGIPGNALAIGGDFVGTSVLSHELGHCFGLFHTHSGRGCDDDLNCAENTDKSNCSTCGDLICDTPADPCLSGNVNANCEYTGSTDFTPDVHNTMSYAPPTCLNHFTSEQFLRMHSTIMNTPALLARSFRPNVSGSSLICSTGATFTVSLPTGYTVSWTCTSTNNNLAIDSNTGYALATGNTSGTGTISAILHTTCGNLTLPAKAVWVGIPPTPVVTSNQPLTVYTEQDIVLYDANINTYPGLIDNFNWTWYCDGVGTYDAYDYGVGGKMYIFHEPGTARIRASAANACGSTNLSSDVFVQVIAQRFLLSLSPNPATGEATIELVSDSKETLAGGTEWELEIYDSMQGMKEKKTNLKTVQTKVNTSSWKDGVYMIRAKIGKDIITGKLVVKH